MLLKVFLRFSKVVEGVFVGLILEQTPHGYLTTRYLTLTSQWKSSNTSGGSRASRREGRQHRRGMPLMRRLLFTKFEGKNKEIGTIVGGGAEGALPFRSTNAYLGDLYLGLAGITRHLNIYLQICHDVIFR